MKVEEGRKSYGHATKKRATLYLDTISPRNKRSVAHFRTIMLAESGIPLFFADALTRRRTHKMRQFASLSSFSSGRASYVYLRDSNSLSLSLSILPLWRIEKRHASKRSFSLCLSLSCERRLRPRMPQGGRRSRNERNVWTAKKSHAYASYARVKRYLRSTLWNTWDISGGNEWIFSRVVWANERAGALCLRSRKKDISQEK